MFWAEQTLYYLLIPQRRRTCAFPPKEMFCRHALTSWTSLSQHAELPPCSASCCGMWQYCDDETCRRSVTYSAWNTSPFKLKLAFKHKATKHRVGLEAGGKSGPLKHMFFNFISYVCLFDPSTFNLRLSKGRPIVEKNSWWPINRLRSTDPWQKN